MKIPAGGRAGLAAALSAAVATALVTATAADAAGWRDPFTRWEPGRWERTAHPLGRGAVDPANARLRRDRLRLELPAGRHDGGEVRTRAHYARGRFTARLRAAHAPGSLTGFFLYVAPDFDAEVDMEVLNDRSGTLLLTTYAGGRLTRTVRRRLGFDPTRAFHTYAFELRRRSVSFHVDGRRVGGWRRGLPDRPMALHLNAWWPRWLEGGPGARTAASEVAWVRYEPVNRG